MINLAGMMGIGDSIHERAIVRALMLRDRVTLETSWPCLWHDLVGPRLTIVPRRSGMRTQAKSEAREAGLFTGRQLSGPGLRVWYSHDQIRATGSFLAAMALNCGVKVAPADFRLPIADAWAESARGWIDRWQPDRPLMIYRPLVERAEWVGGAQRNPDHAAYAELVRSVRARYFVVSVADLAPKLEWQAGIDILPDATCHAAELDIGTLAALTARAGLMFCSPGFALVLVQAVGTPLVAVFGGHESARFYDHGDPRNLLISPIAPCECFNKAHNCDKRIDMPRALAALKGFCDKTCPTDHDAPDSQSRRASDLAPADTAAVF